MSTNLLFSNQIKFCEVSHFTAFSDLQKYQSLCIYSKHPSTSVITDIVEITVLIVWIISNVNYMSKKLSYYYTF